MALTNIKRFFGAEGEVESSSVEEEFYQVGRTSTAVDEESMRKNKMILFEPRAYSESSQIVDYLKNRHRTLKFLH